MEHVSRVFGVALVALGGACTSPSSDPGGGGGTTGTSRVETFDLPGLEQPPDLDLLFVVDDTPAMAAYRDRVLAGVGGWIDELDGSGVRPNLHLGAITADVADGGVLRTPAGTAERYLVDTGYSDGSRTTNFAGALADALASLLDAGSASSATPQPLAATRLALDAPDNTGFARPGAYLIVVMIAASDDASPETTGAYAAALEGHVADPGRIVVSGVYPGPASRLDAFLAEFPRRATYTAIDGDDVAGALALAGELRTSIATTQCITMPLDLAPELDGVQADCAVAQVTSGADGIEHETTVPGCPRASGTCWHLVPDGCEAGQTQLLLEPAPPRQPHLRGQCVVGTGP